MEKKQYYSIRKHKKGAVSVLLFTALFAVAGAGDSSEVKAADANPVATAVKEIAVDKAKEVATDYAKDKLGIVEKEEKPDSEKSILEKVGEANIEGLKESGNKIKDRLIDKQKNNELNKENVVKDLKNAPGGVLVGGIKATTGVLINAGADKLKESVNTGGVNGDVLTKTAIDVSNKFVGGTIDESLGKIQDKSLDKGLKKAFSEKKKILKKSASSNLTEVGDNTVEALIENYTDAFKDGAIEALSKLDPLKGDSERKIIWSEEEINKNKYYRDYFKGLDENKKTLDKIVEKAEESSAVSGLTGPALNAYADITTSLAKSAIVAIDQGFNYMFDMVNKSRIEAQNNNRDSITTEENKSKLEIENEKVFSKKPIKAWVHGSKEGLLFEIEKELGDFKEAQVNGVPLDSSNYNISKGSTIVNLKPEYLDKLHEGRYTLGAIFKKNGGDDYVTTTFDIKRKDDTNKISEKDGIYIVQDLKDLTENNKTDITDTEVKNEVSLVIDTSLSMNGILDQVKEMAKKTVESILKNSNTKINLVGFSGGAGIVVESTNNKQKLFEGIDNLIPFIGTNFYSALETADQSFITNAPNKSIIFMTDGIPVGGKEEEDDKLFTEKEYGELARYANAAVHLKESFKGKYDIYPIGFLNFGEDAKKDEEFAKRLLEKLATKKVYTSDNIDDLEKIFEKVSKDVIKKFDFELGHKLVAKTPEKLVYKLTETVLNPNESDLTKIQTELKIFNQGKVIAPTSVQTIDVISKQGRAVLEWLIELNRKDFKETDKLNFEVITSTSEKLKAAKKAYFNIDNKVTKYEVDRSKIEEIIKDEIEKGKVNVKEILLKELENEAKSEPTESKKGESLIQPENPKYEIPTDKNIEEPKVGTTAKENTHKENLPSRENTVTFKSNEKENVKAPVLLDSKENIVIAKETKTLPNTGTSSQSTAIIGLISAAVALRLRKKVE